MEKVVVENLWNGDRDAQIQAAMELSRFSSKQRHKLGESGVLVPLVSMLHSEDYEAIEASLCALLSLAFGSERNKRRIIKCGALPVLLNHLHSQSQTVVQLTVAAMLTLSSCKANKVAIASSGALQHLAEFVNSGDIQLQLDVVATIHNLSTCEEIVPLIIASGIILSLLELVHNSVKSSPLGEKAIGLLENIVSSSESALCEAASVGGAIRILVETIKYRGLILREGVMPGLLQLSIDGTRRAKNMARELLLLLRDYSDYSSRQKQMNHELIERIMEEIDADGEKLADAKLRLVEEMIAKLNT
ncbi:U-box domain-containing protein 3 [Arachis ipaensis]|uniref:U-box domain-containing protein 3 n=1 Tax=Arachis ipaensis TaxID=130454 RepID=UPI0007AF5CA8|nr:U-box domain-containing protein 3 [Arachis ipaensis]